MRVAPYKVALAVGDPTALDFLGVFRKTLAEGPILPHFNETSRFFWQPRHPPGLIPESWRERGIEIIADPLESENGLLPLAEHVPMESLITFHLQPNEVPWPEFFQPLFRGRTGAEIFLIQNFHVLGAIGMIGSAIVFIKKEERAPISEFLESVLGKMSPPAAAPDAPVEEVPPAVTFEEAFDENDSSAVPQGEMEGVKNQEFDAISRVPLPEEGTPGKRTTRIFGTPPALKPPAPLSAESLASAEDDPTRGKVIATETVRYGRDVTGELNLAKITLPPLPTEGAPVSGEGENPKLVIKTEKARGGRVRGDDITQPLDPAQLEKLRQEARDTSPLGVASIQTAISVQGEVNLAAPQREPSETAIVKHQPEPVRKAGRLDPLRFLLAEFQLALLRRKMKRFATRKEKEPPKLLEKAGKLTKRMEELGERLRIGERMQREREAGRFSFFISLLQRIRKW